MVDISVTMTGVDELVKKLEGLKYDVQKKGGRFALRKAAQVIRNAARQNAFAIDDPATAANISKNVIERWSNKYNRATGDLKFRVGVQGGAGGSKKAEALSNLAGGDTRHWRYVEFGTEKTAAQPFLLPAMNANAQQATNVFIKEYVSAIDRALKKAGG